MLDSRYNFSDNFCHDTVQDSLANIQSLACFNLVTMVGIGVTFLLKAIEQQTEAECVFINSYEMSEFTKEELFAQLSSKLGMPEPGDLQEIGDALAAKAQGTERVVLIFNRIDRLDSVFDQHMYDNLRYLRDACRGKVVIVFVSAVPLLEMSPTSTKSILSYVTKTTYFKGFSNDDLLEICHASGVPDTDIDPLALEYAGGIHTLFQVLIRCHSLEHPLADTFVEAMVKDIYFRLNDRRRKQLETFVLKGKPPTDPYLYGIGYVTGEPLRIMTPLLHEYIFKQGKHSLPVKERRLFRLLHAHKGKLVTKNAIFDHVWREDNGIASDWALNALVYRLKRHPGFDGDRYTIESRKKEGYILHDISEQTPR